MRVSVGGPASGLGKRRQWLAYRRQEQGWGPVWRWLVNVVTVAAWASVVAGTVWTGWWLAGEDFDWGAVGAAIEGSGDDDEARWRLVVLGAVVVGAVVALVTFGPARKAARRIVVLRPWQPHPGLPVPRAQAGRVHAGVDRPWLRGTSDMLAMANRGSPSDPPDGVSVDVGPAPPADEESDDGAGSGPVEHVGPDAGEPATKTVSDGVLVQPEQVEEGEAEPEIVLVFRVLGLNEGITAVPLEVLAYVVTEGQGVIVPKVAARVMGVSPATMRKRCSRLREDGWLKDLKDKAYSLADGVHTDIDELADASARGDKDAAIAIARTVRHRPLVQLNVEWFDGEPPNVRDSVTREVHNLLMECSEKFDDDDVFALASDAIYG